MMTPPLSISANPVFRRRPLFPLFCDITNLQPRTLPVRALPHSDSVHWELSIVARSAGLKRGEECRMTNVKMTNACALMFLHSSFRHSSFVTFFS